MELDVGKIDEIFFTNRMVVRWNTVYRKVWYVGFEVSVLWVLSFYGNVFRKG